jgi:hypothetical protein
MIVAATTVLNAIGSRGALQVLCMNV